MKRTNGWKMVVQLVSIWRLQEEGSAHAQLLADVDIGGGAALTDAWICNSVDVGYYWKRCVLIQQQNDDSLRPIAYWSRTMNPAEKREDKKLNGCTAVVWEVLVLGLYVKGTQFVVSTDHQRQRGIRDVKKSAEHLARRRFRLMEFDVEIVHKSEKFYNAPDALSRIFTAEVDEPDTTDDVLAYCIRNDKDLRWTVIIVLKTDRTSISTSERVFSAPMMILTFLTSRTLRFSAGAKKTPFLQHGNWSHTSRISIRGRWQDKLCTRAPFYGVLSWVVPECLRRAILYHAHNSRTETHSRALKMYDTLMQKYYWLHQAPDVYVLMERRHKCRKTCQFVAYQLKLKLFRAAGPLEFVGIDIMGALPRSKTRTRFITVMTDRYSILTRAIPSTMTTVSLVPLIFHDDWVIPYGIPFRVLPNTEPKPESKTYFLSCALSWFLRCSRRPRNTCRAIDRRKGTIEQL